MESGIVFPTAAIWIPFDLIRRRRESDHIAIDYKKANGVDLGVLVFVIVVMIVAAASAAAAVVVADDFCNSGDFVIANVISHLP